jgi:hypothetical protein
MSAIIVAVPFFIIPLLSVIAFIVSLILFCSGKSKNKRYPESVSVETMKGRKLFFIISSIVAGVFVFSTVAVSLLVYSIIAYM